MRVGVSRGGCGSTAEGRILLGFYQRKLVGFTENLGKAEFFGDMKLGEVRMTAVGVVEGGWGFSCCDRHLQRHRGRACSSVPRRVGFMSGFNGSKSNNISLRIKDSRIRLSNKMTVK